MALISTVTDTFRGTTLDTTKWRTVMYGSTAYAGVHNGAQTDNPKGANSYSYFESYTAGAKIGYDLTNDALFFQVGDVAINGGYFWLRDKTADTNEIVMQFTPTTASMTVYGTTTTTVNYAGAPMLKYFRVRNVGDDYHFETSTTTASWTTIGTVTDAGVTKNDLVMSWGQRTGYLTYFFEIEMINTVLPTTYSQPITATMQLGGFSGGQHTHFRSITAGLSIGAELEYEREIDTSIPEEKQYLIKVYDEEDVFLGVINDPTIEPSWSEAINEAGSSFDLELARNSDSVLVELEPLLDHLGDPILDSDGNQILTSKETRNKVGLGSLIAHGNRVDIWVFYKNALDGLRKFTGFIDEIGTRYGGNETTTIKLDSFGYDLDQYLLETGDGDTTVPFLSVDPADIVEESLAMLPSLSDGETYTTYRPLTTTTTTNYFSNPSFEVNTTGLTGATYNTVSHVTGGGLFGSNYGRVTVGSTMAGNNLAFMNSVTVPNATEMTYSAYIRGTAGRTVLIGIGVGGTGTASITADGDWQRVSVTFTTTATSVNLYAQQSSSGGYVIGDKFEIDGVQLEVGSTATDYLDGSLTDDDTDTYAWTGTANASTSTRLRVVTTSSIEPTGTTISYTFKANTYKEMLDKALQLSPQGQYYRVGLGDNLVRFRQRSETPDHVFYLGKHIKELDLRSYSGDAKNDLLFTGGGTPPLFRRYRRTPVAGTRRGLERMSDNRVELDASADIIANGELDEREGIQYRSTVTILASVYDTETINAGDMVGFANFDNFTDSLLMQVVSLDYEPDEVTLHLDTLPPTPSKRLEDIRRNLNQQENEDVPATPVDA